MIKFYCGGGPATLSEEPVTTACSSSLLELLFFLEIGEVRFVLIFSLHEMNKINIFKQNEDKLFKKVQKEIY